MAKLRHIVDQIEETSIALCLGLMTLITFANVVARHLFNDNILWALETTLFLFAWLVLMGASYAVRKHEHIGVDFLVTRLAPGTRKVVTLIAVGACLAFAILLLKGSWDYWYPFVTERVWLETDDLPMPEWLRFIEPWLNEGEEYEKIPRFIPYMALPLGMALLTLRFAEMARKVWTGEVDILVASHEAEQDLMPDYAAGKAPDGMLSSRSDKPNQDSSK